MRLGFGVGANDVETVLRSLSSMALRYRTHDETTRELAQWCQTRDEFSQVLHPALTDSPGHRYWRTVCRSEPGGAAGLLSVIFKPCYSQSHIDAFCDSLQLFKLGYSWGGPMSLVVPYDLAFMRSTWPAHVQQGILVRFSVGLESRADLQKDIAQALLALLN